MPVGGALHLVRLDRRPAQAPLAAASDAQSSRSAPASDGDTAVTACTASAPERAWATAARNAESAPPLNATTTRPSESSRDSSAASFADTSLASRPVWHSSRRSALCREASPPARARIGESRRGGGNNAGTACSCTPTWRPCRRGLQSASTPTGTAPTSTAMLGHAVAPDTDGGDDRPPPRPLGARGRLRRLRRAADVRSVRPRSMGRAGGGGRHVVQRDRRQAP